MYEGGESINQLRLPMSEGGEPINQLRLPMSEGGEPINQLRLPMSEGGEPINQLRLPMSEGNLFVPYEGYLRNASCALNVISTSVLLINQLHVYSINCIQS
jgi:hypothetical protein